MREGQTRMLRRITPILAALLAAISLCFVAGAQADALGTSATTTLSVNSNGSVSGTLNVDETSADCDGSPGCQWYLEAISTQSGGCPAENACPRLGECAL